MIARASPWIVREIQSATSAQLSEPQHASIAVAGVCTDTRDALEGQLFVALTGERYDAHDFLAQAVEKGAAALLVSETGLAKAKAAGFVCDRPLLAVPDTLFALGELAKAHRARMPATVLALTGSNGKTTTKEMMAAILSVSHSVLKTQGNLNNLIGLPMTLLGLAAEHKRAVIEMGMNTPGEITRYTEIAAPDLGMVINVGPAHIGRLGSIEAIADAKGELFAGLPERSLAVVNADDPLVEQRAAHLPKDRVLRFGADSTRSDLQVRLLSATPASPAGVQQVELEVMGRSLSVELPFPGRHNAMNAAAAICACTAPGVDVSLEDIQRGLSQAAQVAGRLVIQTVGPYKVIDDCYNANAASMRAAITAAAQMAPKRRLFGLLGEMRELGAYSDEEHRAVGRAFGQADGLRLAAFGPLAAPMVEGLKEVRPDAVALHEAEDLERLFEWLRAELKEGDLLLVKGSRGIRMERFIERLRSEVA